MVWNGAANKPSEIGLCFFQSKLDWKETMDYNSITVHAHVLYGAKTTKGLPYMYMYDWLLFFPWANLATESTIKATMLISEKVVPHQKSDWGDNINSSLERCVAFLSKTSFYWEENHKPEQQRPRACHWTSSQVHVLDGSLEATERNTKFN